METENYTEPQIADYGSIAEMTAGRHYRLNADSNLPTGTNLQNESTGPCYIPGTTAPCKL
jgi:hypothetical protein